MNILELPRYILMLIRDLFVDRCGMRLVSNKLTNVMLLTSIRNDRLYYYARSFTLDFLINPKIFSRVCRIPKDLLDLPPPVYNNTYKLDVILDVLRLKYPNSRIIDFILLRLI